MKWNRRARRIFAWLTPVVGALLLTQPAVTQSRPQRPATYPALPSETPETLVPVADSFDYVKRDVMIPMRDGVKLHTAIVVPKGATHAPILLTRTPYNVTELTGHANSAHLGAILNGYDNATEVVVEDLHDGASRDRVRPGRSGQ